MLGEALACAPEEVRAEVSQEQADVGDMKDRASWDDTGLMSKTSRASFHDKNRKRGRP